MKSLVTFRPPPHLSECNEGSGNVAHVQKVSKHVLFEVRRGVTLTEVAVLPGEAATMHALLVECQRSKAAMR